MSLAKLFIVFAVMITAVYSLPLFNRQFNGQGTFYNVGLGACGQTNSDDEYVAALNVAQWGSPPNPNKAPFCGKKATISGPSGTVTVTIVDLCKSCKNGDMDLSPAAFSKIADLSEGRRNMYSKLLLFCIAITLLFSGSASVPLQKRLAGAATFYAVGLGACGQTNTPDQLIAAAGAGRFDSTPGICGLTATITGPKGTVTVTILDRVFNNFAVFLIVAFKS
ncbi:9672_t:CDS:2 [Paraglomus occultum]|uniref:9672_t:CDS:1 n=1 Tax=Paraglomus occultum TaxID=144539 RepID=A0A9N8WKT4_9GLOM|nr:9672_t:CDS:2 [Paraglomus occultum]